jgi:hypothetical protein
MVVRPKQTAHASGHAGSTDRDGEIMCFTPEDQASGWHENGVRERANRRREGRKASASGELSGRSTPVFS